MTHQPTKRLTLFIKPNIVKYAKAQAVLEDISLTTLVERALISYLPQETIIKKAELIEESKS